MSDKLKQIEKLIKDYNSIQNDIVNAESGLPYLYEYEDPIDIYRETFYGSVSVKEVEDSIKLLSNMKDVVVKGEVDLEKYFYYADELQIDYLRLPEVDIDFCIIKLKEYLGEDSEGFAIRLIDLVIQGELTWSEEQIEEEKIRLKQFIAEKKIDSHQIVVALKKLGVEI